MKSDKDEYWSISKPAEGIYKEKGSKFISFLYNVQSEEGVINRLNEIKEIHPKARHVCYAYRLGLTGDQFRINDDGEPSGTAGRPIFNELLSAELTDSLCAVVRYFGGTKLGATGLIRAYKESSSDAINNAEIVKRYIFKIAQVHFDACQMGKVYNSIKYHDVDIIDQSLGLKNWIKIKIRKSMFEEKVNQLLSHFHGVSLEHLIHESFEKKIKIVECE